MPPDNHRDRPYYLPDVPRATPESSSSTRPTGRTTEPSRPEPLPFRWGWWMSVILLVVAVIMVALIRKEQQIIQPRVLFLYLGVLWLALVGSYSLVAWAGQRFCVPIEPYNTRPATVSIPPTETYTPQAVWYGSQSHFPESTAPAYYVRPSSSGSWEGNSSSDESTPLIVVVT